MASRKANASKKAKVSTDVNAATENGAERPQHPSGDRRFKVLEVAMKRHHFRQDALIEVLHLAQQTFGFLELDVLWFVARHLRLPPSRVFGVATFYHLFSLKPGGRHTCVLCTGTACYVKGGDALLEAVEKQWHLKPRETTPGGEVSLVTARCLGACGTAPVVVYDGELLGHQTRESVLEHWKEWMHGEPTTT